MKNPVVIAAAAGLAGWWLTPYRTLPQVAAAAGGLPEVSTMLPTAKAPQENKPDPLAAARREFAGWSDAELATHYSEAVMVFTQPEKLAAMLLSVQNPSVRRHLMDKTSGGFAGVVAREVYALLPEGADKRYASRVWAIFMSNFWYDTQPSPEQQEADRARAEFDTAAAMNPAAALRRLFAEKKLSPAEKSLWVFLAARSAMADSPVSGVSFIESLPEDMQKGMTQGILNELSGSVPATRTKVEAALKAAMQAKTPDIRNALLHEVAGAWVQLAPREAVRWAAAQSEQDFPAAAGGMFGIVNTAEIRPAADGTLIAVWPGAPAGQSDDMTAFALRWASRDGRKPATLFLFDEWSQRDPSAAGEWIVAYADRGVQEQAAGSNAIEKMVRRWTESDARAASQWTNNLPQGTARDAAASGLVEALVDTDPGAAWRWAVSIGDESQRRSMLHRAAWSQDHATIAHRLRTAGASEADAAYLMNVKTGGNPP